MFALRRTTSFLQNRVLGRRLLQQVCVNDNRNPRHMNGSDAVVETLHLTVYKTTLTKAIFQLQFREVLIVWRTQTIWGMHRGTCLV